MSHSSSTTKYIKSDLGEPSDSGLSVLKNNYLYKDELVLKIRIADTVDPDFIEVELPQHELTYDALIRVCCDELMIQPNQIVKLRKLPNTRLRKNKDVQRLQDFQEIEVVTNLLDSHNYMKETNGIQSKVSMTPANGYQSISKKDQTILY